MLSILLGLTFSTAHAEDWYELDDDLSDGDIGAEVDVDGVDDDDSSSNSGSQFRDFREALENLKDDVEDDSPEVEEGSEGVTLPTFETEDEGADIVVAAIQRFLDFFKLIVTPIAVLFIIVMGVRMVTAGKENDEVLTQSKNFISYALQGLILIFMADSLIEVFFGAEGEVLRGGDEGAREFGRQASTLFRGIYGLVEVIIASIAVFMLVMAGMRYVAGSYSDDQITKAKKQITWSLVGLFVIAVSEFAVKDILFENQGDDLGIDNAQLLFKQVTNFVAGTIGTLSFISLFYAGYLYVFGVQSEDNVAKAKKIILGAVLGIILALAAFAITSTIVELDAS